MSHKHPTFLRRARLAPLAAAAALIAATSGMALAQSNGTLPVSGPTANQTSSGPVSAQNNSTAQYTSFPSNGVVNANGVDAQAIGNQHRLDTGAAAALTINNQPLVQPTVSVLQQVNGGVSSGTTGSIGVNANNVTGNHDNSTASVSNNEASAASTGNTSVGTMLVTGGAVDMGTAATTEVTQGVAANAPVSASTDLTRVGIRLNQTAANANNAMDNLTLGVSGNQVDSAAQANTTQAGIQVQASSVNLGAAATSTVDQQAAGEVTGESRVNLVGIRVLGTTNRALTDSQLGVSSNSVQASAGGNQQTSVLQITAAGDVVQTGGAGLVNTATQATSGAINASSNVATLGIDNQKTGSEDNRYSVSGNSVGAQADGNSGSNRSAVAAAGAITDVLLQTSNSQTVSGSGVSASAQVGALGVQTLDSTNDAQTVSANRVQAEANGSSASNQTRAGASDIRSTLAGTSNAQTHSSGSVSASAGATRIGSESTSLSGTSLTVSGNQISAEANGASATNDALLGADNAVTQSAALVGNTQTHTAGAVQASAGSNLVGAGTGSASNASLVVSGNQFSATAASQKADNLARINATNGVSDSAAAVVNLQDHVAGNVSATVAGLTTLSPSPNPVPMLIGLRADTASGSSLTVTGNQGASDAIVNQADNQVALSGSRIDGSSAAYLFNVQAVQSGNAQALTRVNLGVDGNAAVDTTRAGGHELVVSGNQFSANASQNQATNALDISATSTLSADTAQPNLLGNLQLSAGNTTATTEMQILSGRSVVSDASGNTTITGNQASSLARANVANNQLTVAAGTQASDQFALLGNVQDNSGAVTSTASLQMQGSAANRLDGNLTSSSNQALAVAAGNTSLNSVTVAAGTALNSGSGVGLLNAQNNSGAVVASATLNANAFSRGNTLNLSGNTASATAVGNNAENLVNVSSLPGQQMASAVLTSNQVNSGNVSAVVSGSYSASGVASTSGINVSGNRSSAVAIGNRATSSMTLGVQ
ncbi:hypothetical protein M2375_002322 [Comamonas sp. BIGb0152]|uniref:beta strand repeat-containing protein n=1 Tax=Comamonas sp. BIGb0152 TaxID=2940601 RepID=UPI00216A5DBD|nr:hypothetical protein [Comamonas sp. BIGb0152]MCS4294089.1 hypothetical protein [Comamonas sp. BIGb0152]